MYSFIHLSLKTFETLNLQEVIKETSWKKKHFIWGLKKIGLQMDEVGKSIPDRGHRLWKIQVL